MKRVVFGVISAILLFGLINCGGKGEKIQLTYAIFADANWNKMFRNLARKFEEKHPNVEVRIYFVPGNVYVRKLITMHAGGTPPDVFYLNEKFVPAYAKKNILEPLNKWIEQDTNFNINDYFKQAVDTVTVDGKIYQLPVFFSPVVLYYNKSMFDSKGVPYPNRDWKWEDLLKAALKLTKSDTKKVEDMRYGFLVLPWFSRWPMWVWQNGGDIFNSDFTRCLLNQPPAVEAITFLHDLIYKHHVSPTVTQSEEMGADELFVNGNLAMIMSTRFQIARYRTIRAFKWDVAEPPYKKQRATILAVGGNCVSSHSKHKKLAWEFAKFLASEEAQIEMCKLQNLVPTLKKVANSEHFITPKIPPEHDEVFIKALEYARPLRELEDTELMEKVLHQNMQLIWLDRKPVKEVLNEITETLNRELSKQHR